MFWKFNETRLIGLPILQFSQGARGPDMELILGWVTGKGLKNRFIIVQVCQDRFTVTGLTTRLIRSIHELRVFYIHTFYDSSFFIPYIYFFIFLSLKYLYISFFITMYNQPCVQPCVQPWVQRYFPLKYCFQYILKYCRVFNVLACLGFDHTCFNKTRRNHGVLMSWCSLNLCFSEGLNRGTLVRG